MNRATCSYPQRFVTVCIALVLLSVIPTAHRCFALDSTKIFFAGDSAATYCRESSDGPDLYHESLFSRLKASPPPGFTVEPSHDIIAREPCSLSHPDEGAYGALKIIDWNTECVDGTGNGICSWYCDDCPEPECTIHRSITLSGSEADWCCCASRRACIDQSDAQYVILNLVASDLLQLFHFYGGDVDLVIEEAINLTNYLTAQGHIVIWLSHYPIGYGSLGNGETACSGILTCIEAINSNSEYFYEQFIPWINTQPDVHLIDFFEYIKQTYEPATSFISEYGYDNIHLNPSGHQLFHDYVYLQLNTILPNDFDGDGVTNDLDNCWYVENPSQEDSDSDCIY